MRGDDGTAYCGACARKPAAAQSSGAEPVSVEVATEVEALGGSAPEPHAASEDRQVTYSPFAVQLPEVTTRDSNNVERTWRKWKAINLISNPRLLSKMLGRSVK